MNFMHKKPVVAAWAALNTTKQCLEQFHSATIYSDEDIEGEHTERRVRVSIIFHVPRKTTPRRRRPKLAGAVKAARQRKLAKRTEKL